MELRWLGSGDLEAVAAAEHLFDGAVVVEAARRFLDEPTSHLCVAYEEGEPAGFVSGVETTHPDKGTEMFLYELGVDERVRRRGIGTALVRALAERARERGCYGMWVLTDRANDAARGTYRKAGAAEESDQVMLGWDLRPGGSATGAAPSRPVRPPPR
jgi:ribosomal protein S18 acetylase RimI-like enzyme